MDFFNGEALSELKKIINEYDLVIVTEDEDVNRIINSEAYCHSDKKIAVLPLSEHKDWIDMYNTYEFTDKFILLQRDVNHGVLYNYVDTGIMSEEEVFEVIIR